MKLNDAYKMTLESIEFLKSKGLKVDISESISRSNANIIDKYKSPDRLSPDKWIHVSIEIPDNEDLRKLIFDEQMKLYDNNISFDTGAGFGGRDWELDWSFHVRYNEIKFDDLQISFDSKNIVLVEFLTSSKVFLDDIIRIESLGDNGYKIINLIINKINIRKDSDKFQVVAKHIGPHGRYIDFYRKLDLISFSKSNISIRILDKDVSDSIRESSRYL